MFVATVLSPTLFGISLACVAMRPGDFEGITQPPFTPLTTVTYPPTTTTKTITTTTADVCEPCIDPSVMTEFECEDYLDYNPNAPELITKKYPEKGVCKITYNCMNKLQFLSEDEQCINGGFGDPLICKEGKFYYPPLYDTVIVNVRCG